MVFLVLLAIIAALLLDFLFCGLLVKLICWCFGLVFSWKIALGVFLCTIVMGAIFNKSGK